MPIKTLGLTLLALRFLQEEVRKEMIDMPTIKDIRKLARQGESVAQISRITNVSEPTVRKYLRQDDFSPKMPVKRVVPSKLDPYKPTIESWLEEDRRNWRKQRHTAKRVYERLRDEEGYEGSYNTVCRFVAKYKEEHKDHRDEYLDLDWEPGAMQVDFGQADFRIVGTRRRMHHLVGSFPFSNVGLAQVFPGENAECVCAGLISIFEYVGGVPKVLIFDNATGVGRRISGEIRTSALFSAFAAHYGFDYRFCNPNSGHEKGNVENKVGALRRSLFVPIPAFDNIANYNRRLLDQGLEFSRKQHYRKGEEELALFEEDCFALSPLPGKRFNAVRYERMVADKYGNLVVDGKHRYSSDPSLGCCEVIACLSALEVEIYDARGNFVARHERAYGDKPTESMDPVSQLALLCRKPGGWPSSRVRSSLPDALRDWMDSAEPDERSRTLRILRDVTEESGYSAASEALLRMVESGAGMSMASASVLANGIANGRNVIAYDEPVDMSPYDSVFGMIGGSRAE